MYSDEFCSVLSAILSQEEFWMPPLSPCLEGMGLAKDQGATCEDARNLGNAMGALYDNAIDCNRTATRTYTKFTGRGDLLFEQLGCSANPTDTGTYGEL
jgi:hypothetical protein